MPFLSEAAAGDRGKAGGWARLAGTGFLLFSESVYILSASQVSLQGKPKVSAITSEAGAVNMQTYKVQNCGITEIHRAAVNRVPACVYLNLLCFPVWVLSCDADPWHCMSHEARFWIQSGIGGQTICFYFHLFI